MSDLTAVGYLIASVLFVLGLKGLARPRSAVRGNALGALGMLVAVVVTLADQAIVSYTMIAVGVAIGSAIGVALALRVKMTAMPELVALFNGFGGASSALVAAASFLIAADATTSGDAFGDAMTAATAGIGALTLTGSLVAFAKLGEWLRWSGFVGVRWVNIVLAAGAVAAGVALVAQSGQTGWLVAVLAVAAVLGVTGVVPIGGADMPVVIALLNSMSGLAAAGAGFVLDNTVLIVAGALVGASGLILTTIMCRAMNRTLPEVLFADAPGAGSKGPTGDNDIYTGRVRSTGADDVAMILDGARKVAIIPGYGLAVAQAQHAVRDLTKTLNDRGVQVEFGIHPVAGRMPGHMNVLLAEAEIDYELLIEMERINPTFDQVDVAIVLGANDVVNPVARTDPDSPIAGMPILDVDKAQVVVVIKRSLSPGFAGIPNPLFVADNALMYFGDGKQAVVDITRALGDL